MIDLNKLCEVSLKNADERHSHGANIDTDTRKMLKHCATEVVEAIEAYKDYLDYKKLCEISARQQNVKPENVKILGNDSESHFASELADIICCCLIIAGKEKIDIEKAIFDCIEKNRKRAEGSGDKP